MSIYDIELSMLQLDTSVFPAVLNVKVKISNNTDQPSPILLYYSMFLSSTAFNLNYWKKITPKPGNSEFVEKLILETISMLSWKDELAKNRDPLHIDVKGAIITESGGTITEKHAFFKVEKEKWEESYIKGNKERPVGLAATAAFPATIYDDNKSDFDNEKGLRIYPRFRRTSFKHNDNLVFVLMPLSDLYISIFNDHIKPVCQRFGLEAMHAEDIDKVEDIIENVWVSINEARMIIADLSEKNPNVFYELGVAHTVGKKVIMITRDRDQPFPFDVGGIKGIKYVYPKEMDKFEKKLESVIRNLLNSN